MKNTEDYQKTLDVLRKKQKDHESSVMRAQIAQEEAKKKVLEASKALKQAGFASISEAEAEIKRLQQSIEENIEKATKILED